MTAFQQTLTEHALIVLRGALSDSETSQMGLLTSGILAAAGGLSLCEKEPPEWPAKLCLGREAFSKTLTSPGLIRAWSRNAFTGLKNSFSQLV